jgi:hypothetical protein
MCCETGFRCAKVPSRVAGGLFRPADVTYTTGGMVEEIGRSIRYGRVLENKKAYME